ETPAPTPARAPPPKAPPPRRPRPRLLDLPILRLDQIRPHRRPRHPPLPRRRIGLGEHRRRLRHLQPQEGQPAAAGDPYAPEEHAEGPGPDGVHPGGESEDSGELAAVSAAGGVVRRACGGGSADPLLSQTRAGLVAAAPRSPQGARYKPFGEDRHSLTTAVRVYAARSRLRGKGRRLCWGSPNRCEAGWRGMGHPPNGL